MKRASYKDIFEQSKVFAKAHKAISGLIALSLVSAVYGTLRPTNTSAETHYMLGAAANGTIVSTVSGTGQVSASNQVDVKAKASGDILSVNVRTGQEVSAGQLLASIDPGDAGISVQNAELNLEKLNEAPDPSTLVNAKMAVTNAQNAMVKNYITAESDITGAFLDFPSVLDGMNALLYGNVGYLNDSVISSIGPTAESYRTSAGAQYDQAVRYYNALSDEYKNLTTASATSTKDALIADAVKTLSQLLVSMRNTQTAVDYVKTLTSNSTDQSSKLSGAAATTAETNLASWITEMSSHYSAISADQTSIENAPSALSAAEDSLGKLVNGADPLDVKSAELSLEEQQSTYGNYSVRAPFAGVVGKIDVKAGSSASSGAVVATLISKSQIADIPLNEVDAAKVKVGDKANLTFDAVNGLSMTGTVTSIDLVGTVTQGVVTYNAEIAFDTVDPRVLPGMSVSADIIVDAHTDTLTVPSSAVKTDAQGSYVMIFSPSLPSVSGSQGVVSATAPTEVSVTTGISDDTDTEILSGLSAGEQVVTRVVNPSTTPAAATAPSLFGAAGGRAGGGAGARAVGR